jgi:hypothetical protein
LHGKRKNRKFSVASGRQLSIEFSSVIGTRAKDYTSYLARTLYPYELDMSFYESLLEDQTYRFSRHEFKTIVAHMVYYKLEWSDKVVESVCDICKKHQIGYSFVEIMQFLKVNDILVSEAALEYITKTWHRFALINEDMLPFVKEYCKRVNMPFKTSYYSHFCASLIKTGSF